MNARQREIRYAPSVTADYPPARETMPSISHNVGRYQVNLAASAAELDEIQRLRFEVFNLELGEGLERSYATGRDYDRFDEVCHHLSVRDRRSNELVGTYRLLAPSGRQRFGYYSAQEFELDGLGSAVLDKAIELGRACVHADHRNSRVLFLLWYGLAQYLRLTDNRYLFGCCSLTSQDPAEGQLAKCFLQTQKLCWSQPLLPATPAFFCPDAPFDDVDLVGFKLPKLMRMYTEYGAEIVSEPALDQEFRTIDFLALFDVARLDKRARKLFGLGAHS